MTAPTSLHTRESHKEHLRQTTEGESSRKGWLANPFSLFMCGLGLGTQSDHWFPAFHKEGFSPHSIPVPALCLVQPEVLWNCRAQGRKESVLLYGEPPVSPKAIHGRQNSRESKNFDLSRFGNLIFQVSEIKVGSQVQISLKEKPPVTKAPQEST